MRALLIAALVGSQGSALLKPQAALDELRALVARGDWETLAERAAAARDALARGSTEWLEASALLGQALYQSVDFEKVVELGREVAHAVREGAGAAPGEPFEPLDRLDPLAARHALEVYVLLGHAYQARGEHEQAVAVLTPVPGILLHRPVSSPSRRVLLAGLDLGQSLLALGRDEEGDRVLAGVRDEFPGTSAAAMAAALLQARGAGPSAYRGKYQDDAGHARRAREFFGCIQAARKRLAAALGRKPDGLPPIPVGIADQPREHEGEGAFTEGDPRRPFSPIVVVFSEMLALDLRDPLELVVHELAHAVLLRDIGTAYERLPAWVQEGLSNALAGELPGLVLEHLEHQLLRDSTAFLGPQADLRPVFERSDRGVSPEIGLGLSLLEDRWGPGAVRRLIGGLESGRSLDETLRELTGLSTEAYLEEARTHAGELLEREREAARADLELLERARRKDPAAVLEAADAILSRECTALARGHALLLRAASLEALGDEAGALAAYDDLLKERRRHRPLVPIAFLGRARALAALGRGEEAAFELRELERAAPMEGLRLEVRAMLAELGHAGQGR